MKENIQQKLGFLHAGSPAGIEERIHRFLREMTQRSLRLPQTYRLENSEEAMVLSFPQGKDSYQTSYLDSRRLDIGVLHNPDKDVRTTEAGVFWVVNAGLPVPAEKTKVSVRAFVSIFEAALQPPEELQPIPFTAEWEQPVKAMVSAYIRPLVSPEVPGHSPRLTAEAMIVVPGGLVANADFFQRVFGNAGDPTKNDAAADLGWSGHTSCIIVAPHLPKLRKVDIGLPYCDVASDEERESGLAWRHAEELVNGGKPFHLTLRNADGCILTIVADPYFGYDKKSEFMHLGYFANLSGYGSHHSGGVLAVAPGSDQVVCVHSRSTPSGGGKSELANHSASREVDGVTQVRVGHHWVGVQPNGRAHKASIGDDITAAAVVPNREGRCIELVENVESQLFQRPDDAKDPGVDPATEREFARSKATGGLFCTNFRVLEREDVESILRSSEFHNFDPEMQTHLHHAPHDGNRYTACSAQLRILGNGKKTANPRYLQRPRIHDGLRETLALKGIVLGQPHTYPINVEIRGTRTNRPEGNVPALCASTLLHHYDPITALRHAIAPVTGKSPSTDGVMGNEGAVTKKPFQSLSPIHDVEAELVSMVLTGIPVFASISNYCGPRYYIGQDFRQIAPDIFAHMTLQEMQPSYLIDGGFLEKLEDYEHIGRPVPASLLGYRITRKFVDEFFGRVFRKEDLDKMFTDDMLKPELQDHAIYAESVLNLANAQKAAVEPYYQDGSYERACTPVQALLDIMKHGQWQGKGPEHPEVQAMFTRKAVLSSPWYHTRLDAKWKQDQRRLERLLSEGKLMGEKLDQATAELARVKSPAYREALVGHLGAGVLDYTPVV
jgi:hypothetical protein